MYYGCSKFAYLQGKPQFSLLLVLNYHGFKLSNSLAHKLQIFYIMQL